VKTVRDRFDNAMKLVKEIDQDTPFCSGCDNEELPNMMRQLLEDLYELKTSFDDDQSDILLLLLLLHHRHLLHHHLMLFFLYFQLFLDL
jgi:hypothetical protein